MPLQPTSSRLPSDARGRIVSALAATLADGIDLYSQTKTAHWNVKGPLFVQLHGLFDSIATTISETNDEIAERAIILGGLTQATVRRVASTSRIEEYPAEVTDGLSHAALLVERIGTYLDGLRGARDVADELGDPDTVDLLTITVEKFEKHAWFLHATLTR